MNIWFLLVFRFLAALGIGGEWATGASLVAETMPKDKRVLGGGLLYTSAPLSFFLATFFTWLFTDGIEGTATNPNLSWRAVFLTGCILDIIVPCLLLGDTCICYNVSKNAVERT
jgi:MFS family permease